MTAFDDEKDVGIVIVGVTVGSVYPGDGVSCVTVADEAFDVTDVLNCVDVVEYDGNSDVVDIFSMEMDVSMSVIEV